MDDTDRRRSNVDTVVVVLVSSNARLRSNINTFLVLLFNPSLAKKYFRHFIPKGHCMSLYSLMVLLDWGYKSSSIILRFNP